MTNVDIFRAAHKTDFTRQRSHLPNVVADARPIEPTRASGRAATADFQAFVALRERWDEARRRQSSSEQRAALKTTQAVHIPSK
jgi:hypothetical protein